ncbi:MAG: MFS transporter [bacterium]|nr:MFS transporter [bacterium]
MNDPSRQNPGPVETEFRLDRFRFEDTSSAMSRELLLLITLAAVQFTHIMDFMIMMPLGPQLMRVFDIDAARFGILVSAYTFSAGASGFLGSFYIDRFDRRRALLVIYTGFLLGTFACAIAPTYGILLGTRILTGVFGGLIGALVLAIVGDAIPFERRGRAMGIVMLAFSAASVLGVPSGLYLANLFEWHAPFYLLVGTGVFVLALVYGTVPTLDGHMRRRLPVARANTVAGVVAHDGIADCPPLPEEQAHDVFRVLRSIVSDGNQLRALLLMFLMMIGHFAVIPYISPYMVANVGFSEADILYIYMVGGFSTIFTSPLVGRLADRVGKGRVFVAFVLLTFVPIFLITNLGPASMTAVLAITTLFFIASSGRMIPAMALISSAAPPATRGGFLAVQASVQQLGSGAAAFIGGVLITTLPDGRIADYAHIGYLAIAAGLCCTLLVRYVKPVDVAQ